MIKQRSLKYPLLVTFAALIIIGGQWFIALPSCNPRPQLCFDVTSVPKAPFRYRLLSIAMEPNYTANPSVADYMARSILIHSVCALLTCIGLFIWLKRVSTPERAIIGLFILVCDWLLAYWFYHRDIAIAIELTLITWALVLIDGHLLPLAALTALATLNRETGVYIPLIYAAYHFDYWRERRYRINVGVLLGTFAAVLIAIHGVMGGADHVLGLGGTLAYNLETLRDGILINLILLPLWLIAIYAYNTLPDRYRRLMWVAGLMLAAIAIGAAWGEAARLVLVVMPLVLPAIIRS